MRYGLIPTNPIERIAMAAGLIPVPLVDGYAFAFSRALMVATKLGLFDALVDKPMTAPEVADRAGSDPVATEKLLNLLLPMRYVELRDGRYRLTNMARRFIVGDRSKSVRDGVLMKFLEWRWLEGLEDFVRGGRPLDVHAGLAAEDWGLYQRGMRDMASFSAPEVASRMPMPAGATEMLDIGGSHGFYSVALCRRHPGLRATVFDLPDAVEQAAPLLEAEGMGERVTMRAGDALVDDLGESAYDLILMFSLVHHFDDATNRRLVDRAARALRPGGRLVIGDVVRPDAGRADQIGAFFELYFALTSESGLWKPEEMASWQAAAGLVPLKPIHLRMSRGVVLQAAERQAPS
ncbi:MAG TPA: methyltransferase [Candidatus Binatia bacterium]|nr:methyltransferase [Candidatus Binatia bacterium]